MARGQLGQQGYIGMTVVKAAAATRPAASVSRSTTRDEGKVDRAKDSTATTESADDEDGSSASASSPSDDDATPAPAPTSSAEPGRSRSTTDGDIATAASASDDPSGPGDSDDSGDEAGDDQPGDDQPGDDQPGDDQPTAGDGPGSASFGDAVIAIASRYEGTPYRYGGTTPAGFDCSGFTSYVMAELGYDLPRTSGAQRAATQRISRSQAVAGDLVFMPGHVGIYAGNGMMIDSPRSGLSISLRPVYSSSATYGRVG